MEGLDDWNASPQLIRNILRAFSVVNHQALCITMPDDPSQRQDIHLLRQSGQRRCPTVVKGKASQAGCVPRPAEHGVQDTTLHS